MSVTNTPRKAGPYTGNNTDVQYTFGFKVFADSDLVVTRAVIATGVESALVLTTDYTVTRNADQDVDPGGYITLATALADTYTLTLTSAVPDTQPAVFTNLGGFFPAVLNNALDRLTILVQQLKETVGRSLKLAVSTPTGFDATLPAPVPYGVIGFNGTADGFAVTDPSGSSALAGDLAAADGPSLLGYAESGTGMVTRELLDRLREKASIQGAGATANTGIDEHVKMATVITAAIAAGRAIHVPAGTHIGYIDAPSGTVIYGDGPTSILKLPDAANRPVIRSSDTVNGTDNVTLYNFCIDGNEANQGATLGLDAHGIFADGACDNWKIKNLYIKNTKGNGIRVHGSGSTGLKTKAEFIDIIECRFEDAGNKDAGPDGRDAIYLNGLQCARVVGNDIVDAGRQGIALEGSVASSIATRKILVSLNYIKNAIVGAIDDEANNGGQLVITSNMAEDCPGTGVRSTGDNGNTIVDGNWLRACANGIDIENNIASGDAGIVVTSNIVIDPTNVGIKLNKGNFASLESNQVYGSGSYSYYITGDDIIGLKMRGNLAVESVADAFLITGYGRGCSFVDNTSVDAGVPGATVPGFNFYSSSTAWTRSIFALNQVIDRRAGAARGTSYAFRFGNHDRVTYAMNICDGNTIANDVQWVATLPTNVQLLANEWDQARWTSAPSSYRANYMGPVALNGVQATSAAAPTLSITSNTIAPSVGVSFVGAGLIKTITAPSPISTGGGSITIIPTAAFTTDVTGNIAIASTATIGRAMTFTYDVTTTRWYPSY